MSNKNSIFLSDGLVRIQLRVKGTCKLETRCSQALSPSQWGTPISCWLALRRRGEGTDDDDSPCLTPHTLLKLLSVVAFGTLMMYLLFVPFSRVIQFSITVVGDRGRGVVAPGFGTVDLTSSTANTPSSYHRE